MSKTMPTTAKEAFDSAKKKAARLGLSITALCESAGVSPSTVYYWGDVKKRTGYNIAAFLKIDAVKKATK